MLKKALMIVALGVATTSAFAVDVETVEKAIPLKDGSTVYVFKDGKMGMEDKMGKAVMAEGLQTLGVNCTVTDDGMIIQGQGANSKAGETNNSQPVFGGGHITSHHDHRIAMSFTVASLRASEQIIIEGVETVNTSFPGFAELANQIGMVVKVDSGADQA